MVSASVPTSPHVPLHAQALELHPSTALHQHLPPLNKMTKPDTSPPLDEANSLISSHPSTSGLQISLHPLALLTISDYITRHTLRNGTGPIIGALLGTQSGREIAIEHAYEILLLVDDDGVRVEEAWFTDKLKLCEFPPTPPVPPSDGILVANFNHYHSQRDSPFPGPPRLVHHHLVPHLRPVAMDGLPSQAASFTQRISHHAMSQPITQRLHRRRWKTPAGNLRINVRS